MSIDKGWIKHPAFSFCRYPVNVLSLCRQVCPDQIPSSLGERLGDGADGEVYVMDDPTKVIKLCVLYERGSLNIKQNYAKQISKVLQWLIDTPSHTHARVYELKYLGSYTREVVWGKQKYLLYYYTMENLQKLTEDERKILHTILSHEDKNIKKDFSPSKVQEMLEGMSRGLDFDKEKVTFFCNNFAKTPVVHLDIHVRNIMKDTDGNFKLIDFDRAELHMETINVKSN